MPIIEEIIIRGHIFLRSLQNKLSQDLISKISGIKMQIPIEKHHRNVRTNWYLLAVF
jgi:hypothetical protein